MWGGIRFFEGRIASVRELRDRAGIEHASPLDLRGWRVVRAPSSLDLCPLYVIREPRSVRPGGDPSSSGGCPGTWSASRGPRSSGRGSSSMVRVELGRELRIELGDPGGVFVIPGACMSSGRVVREPRSVRLRAWIESREP